MITYFENLLKEINHSISNLDETAFDALLNESITTLEKGNKIIVSGLGKNVPICDKFVGSMLSLGLDAYFLNTNSAVHGDMGVVKKGDLVIILTKSGETIESIYLTQLLKEREANLWLLSFNLESTLTNEISKQIILTLGHEGDMWNIMPNNSTTLNLIVLQALAMQIAEKMNLKLVDFKKNHPGGFIGEVLKNE
ncbi:SIS domain-containing protein [Ureibacillus chungkukjangi]|uniref:SIS domain-containing protein n=1 Tax=Ureibacillus chungkukjangi TaxID=1202712 RepID=UPI00203D06A6|nr:SIS domain-containing protein [Ureibacillus chungkukjangi]MCM3389798.1 SIS domain-containing protein [Ureibacillus chungkukjangi]